MRIAVLGAAATAVLGGTLAIMPLSKVDTPTLASGPCGAGASAGAVCERVASVLMPEAGTPPGEAASAGAVPTGPPAPIGPAAPALAQAAKPAYALPAPHPVAAQVPAPGGVGAQPGAPSASVPGLGVPGVPGQTALPAVGVPGVPGQTALPAVGVPGVPQPGVGIPETDLSGLPPDLVNQAYGLVSGVVAANTVNPIVSGVLGTAGIVTGVGESGLNLLTTLAYLSRANGNGAAGGLMGAAKLVSMLVPTASLAAQSGLPSLPGLPALRLPAGLPALPAAGLPALPAGLPALPAGLPALPAAGLPALGHPTLPAGLQGLPPLPALPPPPQLPPLPPPPQLPPPPPPPPMVCGPRIGFFQPCI